MVFIIKTHWKLHEHSETLHLFGNSLTSYMRTLGKWFQQAFPQATGYIPYIFMMLSNLQNAFQTLFCVNHTTRLWGNSTGYFSVRERAVQRNEAPCPGAEAHTLTFRFHVQAPLPHTLMSLQRQVAARHTGSHVSVDAAELHSCVPLGPQRLRGHLFIQTWPPPNLMVLL